MAKVTGVGGVFFKSKGTRGAGRLVSEAPRHAAGGLGRCDTEVAGRQGRRPRPHGLDVAEGQQMVQPKRFVLHDQLPGRQSRRTARAAAGGRRGNRQRTRIARERQVRMDHGSDGNKVELWEPMLWDDKEQRGEPSVLLRRPTSRNVPWCWHEETAERTARIPSVGTIPPSKRWPSAFETWLSKRWLPASEYIFEMRSKVVLLYGTTERVIKDCICSIHVFVKHATPHLPPRHRLGR